MFFVPNVIDVKRAVHCRGIVGIEVNGSDVAQTGSSQTQHDENHVPPPLALILARPAAESEEHPSCEDKGGNDET
jgi:hypothetical protein